MKRIKYLLLVIIALVCAVTAFSSCSKNDDDNTEASICGKWECISVNYGKWGNNDGMSVGDILYLNEDYTYKIVGNNSEKGTWKQNSGKLLCTSNGFTWTYTIKECTNSKLTVVADGFGITFSFKR